MKKQSRRVRRTARTRRLPDKQIALLDRSAVPWQDAGGTWHNTNRPEDVSVMAATPVGFNAIAVLDGIRGPYLWLGIAAPDTHAARLCYATISGDALRNLAAEILRYSPMKGGAR